MITDEDDKRCVNKRFYLWKALATNWSSSQGPGRDPGLPVAQAASLEGLHQEAALWEEHRLAGAGSPGLQTGLGHAWAEPSHKFIHLSFLGYNCDKNTQFKLQRWNEIICALLQYNVGKYPFSFSPLIFLKMTIRKQNLLCNLRRISARTMKLRKLMWNLLFSECNLPPESLSPSTFLCPLSDCTKNYFFPTCLHSLEIFQCELWGRNHVINIEIKSWKRANPSLHNEHCSLCTIHLSWARSHRLWPKNPQELCSVSWIWAGEQLSTNGVSFFVHLQWEETLIITSRVSGWTTVKQRTPKVLCERNEYGLVGDVYWEMRPKQERHKEDKPRDVDGQDTGGSTLIGNARRKIGSEKYSVPGARRGELSWLIIDFIF